ncbi:MAG TPA: CDP-diacylglycerol--serine O-phosphatidyltransferase [Bacteriovoracaceae bacterium]|nr:CDP-diacylglycerol--serine O-phosphatidyltransferase [Bacteriovoracaceae bacterium]
MLFENNRRWAFFLPNTFTALNMACGFIAILYGFHGEYYKACMFIVLGAIFDSVDGRVARMTNTQSSFGEQFDSMSDLVSFGVSPAIVYYFRFLSDAGRPGMVAAFFFILCGALRLARFNANIDRVKSDYFQGLPIPGGATAVISMILISLQFPDITFYKPVTVTYLLFYAVLMISNIPFSSFKNSDWVRRHKKQVLMIIFLIVASLFIYEEIMLPLIITTYVVSSLVYYLTHRKKFEGMFEWKEEEAELEDG